MQVPSVLLLDDGELECAREVLECLDAEVVYRSSRIVRPRIASKHQLLITTALRALASQDVFRDMPPDERPVWITFHNQDFLPFRERLRRIGVDYLVNTTIEPELFRLLLMRVLFENDERRQTRRLLVGARVNCQLDDRMVATTLAEISPGGCLLLSQEPIDENVPLRMDLPAELGDAAVVNGIPGHVVRVDDLDRAPDSPLWKLAIEFDSAFGESAPSLERIEMGRAIGARVTCFQDAQVTSSDSGQCPSAESQGSDPAAGLADAGSEDRLDAEPIPLLEVYVQPEEIAKDRRIDPRASLAGKTITLLDEKNGIFFGRDLSRRGVCVECRPGISVGDTLTLAIPSLLPEKPLLMRSVVTRDEGVHGLVVQFYDPQPSDLDRLDRIVASLPPIEVLTDDLLGPESVGVVGGSNPERS